MLAGSTHRRCYRNVQDRLTLTCQAVWAGAKCAGLQSRAFVNLITSQSTLEDIVSDRDDPAVMIGGETKALDSIRAVRRYVEDLLPSEGDFHRAFELSRCDRGQNSVGIDPKLAAEAAAD